MFKNPGVTKISHKLAHTSYNLLFNIRELGHNSTIVVYQMGKVGSTTVVKTLRSLSIETPIYHVHRLTDEGLEYQETRAAGNKLAAFRRKAYWAGRHIQSQLASSDFDKRNWLLVSLTRDPIARNISGFFYSLKQEHPGLYSQLGVANHRSLFPQLKKVFLHDYPHDKPLEWFDIELAATFHVDVFQRPFPWSNGYDIYQKRNVRLLVLRLEDLQNCFHAAVEEWLKVTFDSVTLISANQARKNTYQSDYQAFVEWLSLPVEYIDYMHHSRFAQHFYSASELDGFRERWGDKRGKPNNLRTEVHCDL